MSVIISVQLSLFHVIWMHRPSRRVPWCISKVAEHLLGRWEPVPALCCWGPDSTSPGLQLRAQRLQPELAVGQCLADEQPAQTELALRELAEAAR